MLHHTWPRKLVAGGEQAKGVEEASHLAGKELGDALLPLSLGTGL